MLKTRYGRAAAKNFAIAAILDLFLAYLIASAVRDQDFWFVFIVVLLVFWFGYLPFSLKASLYKAILFQVNKASIRTNLVHEFRAVNLPLLSGTEFNDPADLYFQEIAMDDTLIKEARFYAGRIVGQMGTISQYSWVDAFGLHSNLDAALASYFDEMRRDGVTPHGLDASVSQVGDDENEIDFDEQAELATKAKLKSEIGAMSARALRKEDASEAEVEYERARYLKFRSEIEELLAQINDDFYFGAAFHQYAKLVCAAGEPELVVKYLPSVDEQFLRDMVLPDLPDLAEFLSKNGNK